MQDENRFAKDAVTVDGHVVVPDVVAGEAETAAESA